MSFNKAMQAMKYDSRLLEYNLANGLITQAEYDKHLAALNDEAANAIPVTLESDDEEGDLH